MAAATAIVDVDLPNGPDFSAADLSHAAPALMAANAQILPAAGLGSSMAS